jgi:hypothetical protein
MLQGQNGTKNGPVMKTRAKAAEFRRNARKRLSGDHKIFSNPFIYVINSLRLWGDCKPTTLKQGVAM